MKCCSNGPRNTFGQRKKVFFYQAGAEVDERDGDDDKVEPAPRVPEIHNTAHGEKFQSCLEEEYHSQDPIQIVEAVNLESVL
jgi:hypothetical protein